ncbi:MAG: hypothetical protein KF684_02005 [Phycisphaeraceae bacterium]|nr:hypothetical protein [Phycisphaeraceae bacterium]
MILVPIAIVVTLFLAFEVGYQTGKRRARRFPTEQKVETGAVQGAILGHLLGFSFTGAAGRFIERQDLISREANAIGTAHRRADLLDQPHANELKHALVAAALWTTIDLDWSRVGLVRVSDQALIELHGALTGTR